MDDSKVNKFMDDNNNNNNNSTVNKLDEDVKRTFDFFNSSVSQMFQPFIKIRMNFIFIYLFGNFIHGYTFITCDLAIFNYCSKYSYWNFYF